MKHATGSIILLTAVLASAIFLPLIQTSHGSGPPYTWTGPTLIDSYTGTGVGESLPTSLQARNGTLWLAWQSDRFNLLGGIAYKTMTGGVWTLGQQLPSTNTGTNTAPYLAQLSNGTILIFWSVRTTGNFNIWYKRYNSVISGWSVSTRLPVSLSGSLNDTAPSAAVGADGTLWLFWQGSSKACGSCLEDRQLYYATLAKGVWSSDVKLTSDTNWNWGPSAMVGKDGKVRVVFSKGQGALNNNQLYSIVYNGTKWGPPTCLSTSTQCLTPTNSDEQSSLLQDRNGTLWLFWGRQASTSQTYYYILFSKYSVTNGQTWSAETQVSSESAGTTSQTPAVVQTNSGTDKSIRVFYISDRAKGGTLDIWAYVSPSISPVHDVRINFVSPSTPLEYPGGLAAVGMSAVVTITVSVSNLGDSAESSLQVSAALSNTTTYNLGTQTAPISLGGSVTLFFSWNTTGVTPAQFTLSVNTVLSPAETVGNAGDNSVLQKDGIHIIPFGDINQDGQVSLTDVSVCVYGFGSAPGSPRWNPFCDMNNSGIIDVIDVGVAVHNFGVVT